MRDRLCGYPGLSDHPEPGTSEFDQLRKELEFMLAEKGCSKGKLGRKDTARQLLKFMVGRGYWPLGTKCRVTRKFKVKTVFPGEGK